MVLPAHPRGQALRTATHLPTSYGMEAADWSRQAIADFVRGRRIFMRGADAELIEPPEWIAEAAGEVSNLDSAESVEVTHPDDRVKLIEVFLETGEKPWLPVPLRIRSDHERSGVWHYFDMEWVNLLDHPDVQGILCAGSEVEGDDIEAPTLTFEGVMAATNWMIAALDDRGRITAVRGRLEAILGYTEDEVLGRLPTDFIHPDCVAGAIENWLRLKEDPNQTRTTRWPWIRKDGAEVWIESSYLVDEESVEVVIVDVSEQVANEEALAVSRREIEALAEDFRLLADEVPAAVFRCDFDGRVDFHNAHWVEMFHTDGQIDWVQDVIEPADRRLFGELIAGLAANGELGSRAVEVRAAGAPRVLEIRCRAVTGGERDRFVGSIADVTAAATFRHQAFHDSLTGLGNRAMVEAELTTAADSDPDRTVVVFIDLDGFKAVNDRFGHAAGDEVLVEVGRRLSGAVRPGDAVARFGGDEFVIVCRGVSDSGEDRITSRVELAFTEPIALDGGSWTPGASIGVARLETGLDPAEVLDRADRAMFEVKRTRRGA